MIPKSVERQRQRGVSTVALLFDEALTRAAIDLAAPWVDSEEQAVKGFLPLISARRLIRGPTGPETIRQHGERMLASIGDSPTFDSSGWSVAQRLSRSWLPKLAEADRLPRSSRAALLRSMNKAMGFFGHDVRLKIQGTDRERTDLALSVDYDSIQFATVRAFLPFLVRYGWPPQRIGKCQLVECGRWFLRGHQTGPREQYCEPKHASRAHVSRYRGRHA